MLFRVSLTCGLFCFAVADSARAQNSVPAFGYAIVTHGDRVLVGAPEFAMEVKTPAIYLFQRVGEEHRLLRKFEVPGLAKHVRVGERIAIGKTAVATGAPRASLWFKKGAGKAFVYDLSKPKSADKNPQSLVGAKSKAYGRFGESVVVGDDFIVVGSEGEETVSVFRQDRGKWSRTKLLKHGIELKSDSGVINYGKQLALDGSTLLVAGDAWKGEVSNESIFVFPKNKDGDFDKPASVLVSGDPRKTLAFGSKMAIADDVIVVGDFLFNANGQQNAGAAFIYVRGKDGKFPRQPTAKLIAPDPRKGDYFGISVAIFQGRVLVGASERNDDRGAVFVYEQKPGDPKSWSQVAVLEGLTEGAEFGMSIASAGDTLYIGQPFSQQITPKSFVSVFVAEKGPKFKLRKVAPILIPKIGISPEDTLARSRRTIKGELPTSKGRKIQVASSKSTGMKMGRIEPGKFEMGSPTNEKPQHRDGESLHLVRITRPFLLGMHEVSQSEFEKVMGYNPSAVSRTGRYKKQVGATNTSKLPVETVSWYDAVEFCNRLSKKDGLSPYYEISEARRAGKSIDSAKVKVVGGSGYRLPTEAEWEFACRAGTTTAYNFGPICDASKANVNTKGDFVTRLFDVVADRDVKDSTLDRPSKVGRYKPNRWGLYSMHGNVREWVGDRYQADYYHRSPTDDPTGPKIGDKRIQRGGCWRWDAESARAAYRHGYPPNSRREYVGFRIARSLGVSEDAKRK